MTTLPTSLPSNQVKRSPRTPLLDVYNRAKTHIEEAMMNIGGVADLAVQTVRATIRGPIERDLLMAQFDQIVF